MQMETFKTIICKAVAESSEPGGYFTLLLADLSRLCQVRWPEFQFGLIRESSRTILLLMSPVLLLMSLGLCPIVWPELGRAQAFPQSTLTFTEDTEARSISFDRGVIL